VNWLTFGQSASTEARAAIEGRTVPAPDGAMWPTSDALIELTAADEKRLGELVKTAAG
jgi:hypothetical protein